MYVLECDIVSFPELDIDPYVTHDDRAKEFESDCPVCEMLQERLTEGLIIQAGN